MQLNLTVEVTITWCAMVLDVGQPRRVTALNTATKLWRFASFGPEEETGILATDRGPTHGRPKVGWGCLAWQLGVDETHRNFEPSSGPLPW